jgi:shikimate dehydrogenase
MSEVKGTSRLLLLIGDPVEHSVSPLMHNAAMRCLGLDAVYAVMRTEHSALAHVVRACESVGIAGNVTVPHKIAVARLLIRLTPLAKELGAVNTFWPDGGRLVGDNTDVRGVLDALQPLHAEGPWLVAGTGGGARGVAVAAREQSVTLLVRSRDAGRGSEFVEWAREIGVDARPDDDTPVRTAINATPLGLAASDPEPIPGARLDGCGAALDLVYAPGETAWVRNCRRRGMRAADGRGMVVAQGAYSLERFFPGVRAPREVMAAAVRRALT